jgi:hypothetical protein
MLPFKNVCLGPLSVSSLFTAPEFTATPTNSMDEESFWEANGRSAIKPFLAFYGT